MKISPDRLEFAAMILFREASRQYIRLYPGKYAAGQMPVEAFHAYPIPHQRAFMAAMEKAFEAVDGMEELFQRFVAEKQALAAANGFAARPQQ